MRDDRTICEHAGYYANRLGNAWKMIGGSDADDSVVRAQMMAMIERCPSGALTYRMAADGDDIEPDLPVAIGVVDDGPLFVTGTLAVSRADGAPFASRNRMPCSPAEVPRQAAVRRLGRVDRVRRPRLSRRADLGAR